MGFRGFLEQLEREGKVTRIKKQVSTELELAGIIDALGEKPCFFENVKESSMPVVAGLVSSKELVAKSLNMDIQQILPKLSKAIENPVAPAVVKTGECQEVVEKNVDLARLPIMRYTEKDGGRFFGNGKDPISFTLFAVEVEKRLFHFKRLRKLNEQLLIGLLCFLPFALLFL